MATSCSPRPNSSAFRSTQFAARAFTARTMPVFGYGCAVFMQSDIVNFQRQGWAPEEILAGLAAVLPKNIFLYVASIPNLAKLGTRFILQGGTQHNLAVVKAEVDFIRANFRGTGVEPEIIVHEHCGESGAIGAAVEARRLWTRWPPDALHRPRRGPPHRLSHDASGGDALQLLQERLPANVHRRCDRPPRRRRSSVAAGWPSSRRSRGPTNEQRLIIATCEKGAVEDVESMRGIKADLDAIKKDNPNFVEIAAREVWHPRKPECVADPIPARAWTKKARRRAALIERRRRLRIGMPRVLNMYVHAPFFSGYFESLGVPAANLVYSDFTSNDLYRQGAGRGAIDPCFPSKIAIAHVHNLLFVKHAKKPLDVIFFPMVDMLQSPLTNLQGTNACPTVTVTPETVKAAFTKESNVFAEHGVAYLDPLVNFADRQLLGQQMFRALEPVLGLSPEENARAIDVGFRELAAYEAGIRRRARAVLDQLEQRPSPRHRPARRGRTTTIPD